MLLEFGKKFTDQWGPVPASEMKLHWAQRLAGYSDEELRHGLNAVHGVAFCPTLPEFCRFCRPAMDPLAAYYEAVKGMEERRVGKKGLWSHPAVFWASVRVGSHDLLNVPYGSILTRWRACLNEELAKNQWEAVPEVPPQLPGPNSRTPAERELALQMLRELKATCVFKSAVSCTSKNTRWAEKVLQRAADGDLTVTITMVEFAKETLGLIPRKGTR